MHRSKVQEASGAERAGTRQVGRCPWRAHGTRPAKRRQQVRSGPEAAGAASPQRAERSSRL
eukprot:1361499-Alexandrium_andersonii.AAC.1